ncbi:hypothetical protein ZIOFF_031918 [Zingiber officinale]|uniref:Cysteine proteinase inhibitor n=1 Tax=Zingiber officinale TaxID=94328 RepID=A0A8J5GFH8_ZINOF|nr:hypothetical protein ZIOFF_031918 [Zingiber officinale]
MILLNHATVSSIHLKSSPRSIYARGVGLRYWHLSIVCKKEGQVPPFYFVLSFYEGLDLGDFIAAGMSPTSSISKAPLQKDIENGSCLGLSSEEYNREACLDASERESTVSITVFGASGDLAKKKIFPALDRIGYGIVLTRISRQNALLKFTQLLKAKEQVVAGKMYYLTLEANDYGSKKQYEAKVWVKPWMNFMELEDFKPLTDSPSTSSQDKKQLEQSSEGEKKESVGAPSENKILKQKKSKKEKSSKEQEEHDQNQEKGDIEVEVADASAVDVKERIKKVASMR